MPRASALAYRADIDGLRAIAVTAVLVYHADPAWLPGGLLGVDLFFVLSGYLITSIGLAARRSGRFRIRHFYERRARRLLPALLLVIGGTLVSGLIVLQPQEMYSLAKSTVAALLWVANILFWQTSGYFGEAANAQPLLHLWSLSVEEQYYLFFPLLLAFLMPAAMSADIRTGRRRGLILFVACAALAAWGVARHPSAAFFLLPFRAWELLAGAWLACWHHGRADEDPAAPKPAWHTAASLVAVLALIGVLGLPVRAGWPGWISQAGILATTLVLLDTGRSRPTAVHRALSAPPVVFVGLISYSLYLWHQPILTLIRLQTGSDNPGATGLAMALSVVLAWATWRFVERPFRARDRVPPGWFWASVAVVTTALVLTCAWLLRNHGLISPASDFQRAVLTHREQFAAAYQLNTCFLDDRQRYADFQRCEWRGDLDPADRTLLWGDSYAAHWWPGIVAEPSWYGTIQHRSVTGCPPLPGDPQGAGPCEQIRQAIMADVRAQPPRRVLLSARWAPQHVPLLVATIRDLRAAGVRSVTVLGPTPRWRGGLPGWLALDAGGSRLPAQSMTPSNFAAQQQLDRLLASATREAGGQYVELLTPACPSGSCTTLVAPSADALTYWDDGHLTPAGAKSLMQGIRGVLRDGTAGP